MKHARPPSTSRLKMGNSIEKNSRKDSMLASGSPIDGFYSGIMYQTLQFPFAKLVDIGRQEKCTFRREMSCHICQKSLGPKIP